MANKKKKKLGSKVGKSKVKKASKAKLVTGKRLTSKDFQIAFLLGGVDDVAALDASRKVSGTQRRLALLDAVGVLQGGGKKVDALAAYVAEHYPVKGRGRMKPVAGTSGDYKAQQLKNQDPFLRLPLMPLGVKKGSLVNVSFEDDKIVVTRAA